MNRMSSYDINYPLIAPRTYDMWVHSDPIGTGEIIKHHFKRELFTTVSMRSEGSMHFNGMPLNNFSTFDDYHGIGTSMDDALLQTFEKYESINDKSIINCNVKVYLERRLVTLDKNDTPFYIGAVRAFHVPYQWRCDDLDMTGDNNDYHSIEEIVVWEDGEYTARYQETLDFIEFCKDNDAVKKHRKRKD